MMRLTWFTTGFLLLGVIGCGSSDDDMDSVETAPVGEAEPADSGGEPDGPFQELFAQGIDRYLGMFTPTAANALGGGVTNYTFDGSEGGPLCFTGESFNMTTRDGSRSDLMIFLQGGGVCSPTGCDAVETTSGIPPLGILNPATPGNPTATYNVGYLPYCDGSLFTGDSTADSDGDGSDDRFFRGLKNLSASLDVIVDAYPAPSRILLIGNSAGGAGTHFALPLVRKLYPGTPIYLVNDSGPGFLNPGSQESLNAYWNSTAFFPESCETCIGDDGNLTDYYKYQLSEDPDLRMGFVGSKQDEVIVASLMVDGLVFEEEMLGEVAELNVEYPDRYRSLIADGDEHTFVLRQFSYAIAGTTVRQWITDMLDGSDNWVSLSD